jgi:hypothetical protein
MKRHIILFLILIVQITKLNSQISYPCDSIPTHLRAGARAVVRSSQVKITVNNERQSLMEVKGVVTLLNEKAEDYLIVEIPYDDLRRVSSIKASAYDESGKLVWNLKKYEIYDMRDFGGPEVISDTRKKVFEIPSYNYPFTISYSYQVSMEDLFLSPAVYLQQDDPALSVEESGLQYIIPAGFEFNYKTFNLKSPTDSFKLKGKLYLTWREENLQAERHRRFAPPLARKLPVIFSTPLEFNLKGYKGNLNSWEEFGRWFNNLNEGRDLLDKVYADKAIALVRDIPDRRKKIKTLYEYMQKNTRYFLLAFGVGGFQPIPANEVAKNGYGDCKALSNYMKALLKAVGIESYYTLVRSGAGQWIQPDFPGNQFDHVILCVPDNEDTIWLECTDQKSPFNYLGSFTCDRDVLAITPEGGRLIRTPPYGQDVNIINTISDIKLSSSGDATIRLEFEEQGLMYEDIFRVSERKPDQRKLWLASQVGYAAFDLKKEEFSFDREADIPVAKALFEIRLRDLAARSSNMLFIAPSFLSGLSYIMEDPTEVELGLAFQQNDSVRIEVPAGYKVEFLPVDKQVISKFGNYKNYFSVNGGYIYFTRKLSFNKARYSRETYPEFYHFITDIARADKEMVVLKKD